MMALTSEVEQSQMISKLRELFHLLNPENSALSKMDKGRFEEIQKMYRYITQCSRKVADYYRSSQPREVKHSFSSIVPRFMKLLRESVLSHQWPKALKLTQALCNEQRGTSSAVWKIGLACLYQGGERNSRLVEQFVKQVYFLKKVAVIEVMLDYLLFLLKYTNIEDAKCLVQGLNQISYHRQQLRNNRRKEAYMLFFAYQGLALYAEWKLAVFKAEQEEEDDSEYVTQMLSQGMSTQSIKSIANSAEQYLIQLQDKHGVWDIFVTRLVEIYEYYGETEKARSVLMSYREHNCGNPNAHRFLYEFECNHDGDESVQLQCLKEIARLDPSNPLCLKLYQRKEQEDPGLVSLLFDFLDFSHCSDHEEAWQILADTLSSCPTSELQITLNECWKTRKDWWPHSVFIELDDAHHLQVPETSTLLRNKRIVQSVLLNLDQHAKTKKHARNASGDECVSEIGAKRMKTEQQVL